MSAGEAWPQCPPVLPLASKMGLGLFVQGMHKWKFLTPQRKEGLLCERTGESRRSPEEVDTLSAAEQKNPETRAAGDRFGHELHTHDHTHTITNLYIHTRREKTEREREKDTNFLLPTQTKVKTVPRFSDTSLMLPSNLLHRCWVNLSTKGSSSLNKVSLIDSRSNFETNNNNNSRFPSSHFWNSLVWFFRQQKSRQPAATTISASIVSRVHNKHLNANKPQAQKDSLLLSVETKSTCNCLLTFSHFQWQGLRSEHLYSNDCAL